MSALPSVLRLKCALRKIFNFVNKLILLKTKLKIKSKIHDVLGCLQVTMTTVWALCSFAISDIRVCTFFFFPTEERVRRGVYIGTRKSSHSHGNLEVRRELCYCRYLPMLVKQTIFIFFLSVSELLIACRFMCH